MDFGRIPSLWINALIKPKETFKNEKKNAKLVDGIIHILLAGFIIGLIISILSILFAFLLPFGGFPFSGFEGYYVGSVIVSLLFYLIFYPIVVVIGTLILAGIFFIIARIQGGEGSFDTQYYLGAIFYAPIMIISSIISLIPCIGAIISLAIFIYALYLLTLSIKEAHGLDTLKAVITWLVPGIVIGAILAIFFIAGLLTSSISSIPEYYYE